VTGHVAGSTYTMTQQADFLAAGAGLGAASVLGWADCMVLYGQSGFSLRHPSNKMGAWLDSFCTAWY
jgi:hypothetical protein